MGVEAALVNKDSLLEPWVVVVGFRPSGTGQV